MSETVHNLVDRPRPEALPIAGDFPLDVNVLAKLPKRVKVLSANRAGTSAWTITARINAELEDGAQVRYFLKCATEEHGRVLMEGEFNAMTELYHTMPDFVPEPYTSSNLVTPITRKYLFWPWEHVLRRE